MVWERSEGVREDGPEDEDEETIINFGYYDSNVFKCCFSLLLSFAGKYGKQLGRRSTLMSV